METIEYGEHCYGSYIIIDDENLDLYENDKENEYNHQLKLKLVNELPNVIDRLSIHELKQIAEIITQNNSDWEYDEHLSKTSTCDQCGNYNYNERYRRVK